MKKIFISALCIWLLTGCPSKEDVRNMTEGLKVKKDDAVTALSSQTYTLENLLKAQDYFFDFSEKVHLIKSEPEANKIVQKMIGKEGVKLFCESYILPSQIWEPLSKYCLAGSFYKCSPEIKEYKNILMMFKELAGTEYAKVFASESSCN